MAMKINEQQAVVEYGGDGFSPDAVAFTLKTLDGTTHQFAMKADDVQYFVAGLVTLARQSAELNGPLPQLERGAEPPARPMMSTGVAAIADRGTGDAMLVVHTGGFPMKFSTSPNAMFELVSDLEQLGMARRS